MFLLHANQAAAAQQHLLPFATPSWWPKYAASTFCCYTNDSEGSLLRTLQRQPTFPVAILAVVRCVLSLTPAASPRAQTFPMAIQSSWTALRRSSVKRRGGCPLLKRSESVRSLFFLPRHPDYDSARLENCGLKHEVRPFRPSESSVCLDLKTPRREACEGVFLEQGF